MIDVNDLKGLLELANDYVDDGLHFLTEPVSYGELKLLAERLISAEKDAARYRWLDEQNKNVMSKVMVCNGWIDDGDDVEYVSDLASFIDEAMQCNGDSK